MAATLQGHQVHPEGRTWKTHFPQGDLWVFGYGESPATSVATYGGSGRYETLLRFIFIFLVFLSSTCDDLASGPSAAEPAARVLERSKADSRRRGASRLQASCSIVISTDHRGTPAQPGRVVTVIEREFWETLDDPLATWCSALGPEWLRMGRRLAHLESESASTGKVWGAAYHIPASHAEEVHDYLDEREIDGYSAHYTPFHPTAGTTASPATTSPAPIICMVYIGQPTNPQFLRDPVQRAPQDVAQVISAGHGQSGKNTEYLFLLEKALESIGLGSADVHVTDLVRRVRAIEADGLAEAEEKEAERDVQKYLATAATESMHGDKIE
ncbi:hypothetical protein N7462_001966 [Penicillium macrosclerotiorum]|uniref:uncharacterized protein n=1 Tax=Penicillium macrosclerotiorum TaxID=303699 RepID=UPI002548B6C4|nr:uncharacterized protein N7462_001966 [Penicillium macrosclerotiorum]KAJ5692543.1 hypothetical protein N7462_001966 [Penicillium macrosclerotiorum]